MMEDKQEPANPTPPLDVKLQLHLGDKLKLLFAETAQTPIPDRFAQLLDQLESAGVAGVQAQPGSPCKDADDASEARK